MDWHLQAEHEDGIREQDLDAGKVEYSDVDSGSNGKTGTTDGTGDSDSKLESLAIVDEVDDLLFDRLGELYLNTQALPMSGRL